jgi:hypothetical protein
MNIDSPSTGCWCEQGPEGLAAGAIGERMGLVPSSLTFHLQALQRAGLVTQVRASRQLIYSADYTAMNELVGYLHRQLLCRQRHGLRGFLCNADRKIRQAEDRGLRHDDEYFSKAPIVRCRGHAPVGQASHRRSHC